MQYIVSLVDCKLKYHLQGDEKTEGTQSKLRPRSFGMVALQSARHSCIFQRSIDDNEDRGWVSQELNPRFDAFSRHFQALDCGKGSDSSWYSAHL